jgi:hypothetical protein
VALTMTTIDLSTATTKLDSLIKTAVTEYIEKHRSSPSAKKHPVVTRIDLAFSLGDGESEPWVHLHFDTKPGSEPDGSPTHPDFAVVLFEEWLPAVTKAFEGEDVTVVDLDDQQRTVGSDELTEVIGQFLVQSLLKARDTGWFKELPRDGRCELGVEDPTTGSFGWPNYEERGRNNLLV